MVRLSDPKVWKSLGGVLAGGAVAGLLFDAPGPVDDIATRVERMGFEDVTINRVGSRYSVDFKWPTYPQLADRDVASSLIVDDVGAFRTMTFRFPGFPRDEYGREEALAYAKRAARAGGVDPQEGTRLNTWAADFHAPHVHAQRSDYPEMSASDALDVVRHGKDDIDSAFGSGL